MRVKGHVILISQTDGIALSKPSASLPMKSYASVGKIYTRQSNKDIVMGTLYTNYKNFNNVVAALNI